MMDLKEESTGDVSVIEVGGRLDSATAPTLHEHLSSIMASEKTNILVDFNRLEYISSAGFRVLLLAVKRADQTASKLVLCGLSGKVKQLFDLGGFLDLFSMTATRGEGIAALK